MTAGLERDVGLADHLRGEVEMVHDFIAAWFRGDVAPSAQAFDAQLTDRLAPSLVNIQPSGRVLLRDDLLSAVRDGYRSNPDFQISVEQFALRAVFADATLALATYVEFQRGAKNTTPSDNTRLTTVLFFTPTTSARPTWLHLHETALPA